jgi:hypothetical protein
MNKFALVCCIALLFCNCASTKNIGYTDYEHSVNLTDIQIGDFYFPTIDISINNKNFYATYNSGYKKNFINKKLLNEIGIEIGDSVTDVTIPQIILPNGVILYNIVCDIIEFYNDVIHIGFGLSAFKEYNVLVSYRQNKIFLYDYEKIPDYVDSWVQADVVYPEGGVYIYGGVEGSSKNYLFNLDTGITLYVGGIFNKHYNIGLDMSMPVASFFKNTIIINGKKYKNLYFFNSLSKEDKEKYMFDNILTNIILGYDFFKKNDVFIVNNNEKIYIRR